MKSRAEPSGENTKANKQAVPARETGVRVNRRWGGSSVAHAGNQAMQRALTGTGLQPKLKVGLRNDALEGEAERISRAALSGETRATSRLRTALPESSALVRPPGRPGLPLRTDIRERIENQLGADLRGVRVHTSPAANQAAAALGARAFTHRNDIWMGRGERANDVALLAHEATHVVQQHQAPHRAPHIQRQWEPPSAEESRANEQTMVDYLGAQSYEMLAAEDELSQAHPQTPEAREALEETLLRAVRLNALGMMSSHRASVEEARDRLEGRERFQTPGGQAAQPTSGVLADMREAAELVNNLRRVEAELENYRFELAGARTNATFHRGSLNDTLHIIVDNGRPYMNACGHSGGGRSKGRTNRLRRAGR